MLSGVAFWLCFGLLGIGEAGRVPLRGPTNSAIVRSSILRGKFEYWGTSGTGILNESSDLWGRLEPYLAKVSDGKDGVLTR